MRLHASYGTGIRPPGGSDLAFTNNPALRPERTESYDFGIEQRLLDESACRSMRRISATAIAI